MPISKFWLYFLGPNDPWDMPDLVNGGQLKFQTPEWEMGYRQRMMDILDSAKITIRKSFGSHTAKYEKTKAQ